MGDGLLSSRAFEIPPGSSGLSESVVVYTQMQPFLGMVKTHLDAK